MKKILLIWMIFCLPLIAEEIWLGVVWEMSADTLLLVDGLKIHVPGLSAGRFVAENNVALDSKAITFPFKASLVIRDEVPLNKVLKENGVRPEYAHYVYIKIHNFCDIKDGRLVDR